MMTYHSFKRWYIKYIRRIEEDVTFGEIVADKVAACVGSWPFIIGQSLFLAAWIIVNVTGLWVFDEYPFILMNLALSFQAAFTAPLIMISQNRQSKVDRDTMMKDLIADLQTADRLNIIEEKLDQLLEKHRS